MSSCYSYRRLGFESQHPLDASRPSVTPTDWIPSKCSYGHAGTTFKCLRFLLKGNYNIKGLEMYHSDRVHPWLCVPTPVPQKSRERGNDRGEGDTAIMWTKERK